MAIKNIIFDLGGVFIKIHYQRTSQAFEALGIKNFDSYFKQDYSNPLFEDFEKGLITPDYFFDAFRAATNSQLTNQQITTAWNAMLGDFWEDRILWLQQISKHYKVFLYSNTNQVHYNAFIQQYTEQFSQWPSFNSLFIKPYYSHQLHQRKPNANGYLTILQQQQLLPAETLFVDDTLANIEAAEKLGMQVLHLTADKQLTILAI